MFGRTMFPVLFEERITKMTGLLLLVLTACGPATPPSDPVPPAEVEAPAPEEAPAAEPSKEAVAHYCTGMAAITPESLAGVAPAEAQATIAKQLAEAAKSKNIADWSSFEKWLQATEPAGRQAALDQLIAKYELQAICAPKGAADAVDAAKEKAVEELRKAAQ